MRTINLTETDVTNLLFTLGVAMSASKKLEMDKSYTCVHIADRVLMQLNPEKNETYGKPREEVLADLRRDGLIPDEGGG